MISAIHKQDGALDEFERDALVLIGVDNFKVLGLLVCLSVSSLAFVST